MNYLRKFIIALSLITLNDRVLYAVPPAFSEQVEEVKKTESFYQTQKTSLEKNKKNFFKKHIAIPIIALCTLGILSLSFAIIIRTATDISDLKKEASDVLKGYTAMKAEIKEAVLAGI
jgi:membrane-anchored glycerophosphoryl diester phosphodiesterase (GDPDase)